jgi:uncharacterized membrane protein YccC
MSALLPLATAVEDRLEALEAEGHPLEPDLRRLIEDTRAFAATNTAAQGSALEADRLIEACAGLKPELDAECEWPTLLRASLLRRLEQLIRALQDCRDLRAYVRAPTRRPPDHLDPLVRARARRPLHLDYGLALLSSAAAVLAIGLCCVAWIGGSWPEGGVAALMAAIACSFFASQDDPAPSILGFLIFTTLSLPVAALYLFAILPGIDGFSLLVLSLAPVLLPLGYFMADPVMGRVATPFMLGIVASLSLTETFNADFASFANNSLAQIVGLLAAIVATRLVRSAGAEWTAWRILRSGWRDMARLARSAAPDRAAWTSLMLDRLGLLVPRLALAGGSEDPATVDALNDLRVGLNLVDLQLARPAVGPSAERAIGGLVDALGAHFRDISSGRPHAPGRDLLGRLDMALDEVAACPDKVEGRASAVALTSLRRNLFPQAPPYRPLLEAAP